MKHTDTKLFNDGIGGCKGIRIGAIDPSDNLRFLMCEVYGVNSDGIHDEESHANAQRIVDCWNACEGIENPADLHRQRDELIELIEEVKTEDESEHVMGTNWHERARKILYEVTP